MGRIKSALEIALERTESVKSNADSVSQFEAKQNGKRVANSFLAGENISIKEKLKSCKDGDKASFADGLFDALISALTLPAVKEDSPRTIRAARGLAEVLDDKRFTDTASQLDGVIAQYLDEKAQYEEAIKRQYEPKLRQKEEELSRRMGGRPVRIDPFQDPEFVQFYKQTMARLESGYQQVIEQVKDRARQTHG